MTEHGTNPDASGLSLTDWPLRGWALSRFALAYLVLVAVGLGVGGLLVHTPVGDPVEDVDVSISRWIATEREPFLTSISDLADQAGATIPVVAMVVVLSVGLVLLLRRWLEGVVLATALSLEALVFLTVSLIIGRMRPPIEQLDPSPPTASFPSGHTGAAFALYVAIALIVWRKTDNRVVRWLAATLAVLLGLAVAGARLYRGMHFVSDVIIGAILGAASAWAAITITERAVRRNQESAGERPDTGRGRRSSEPDHIDGREKHPTDTEVGDR